MNSVLYNLKILYLTILIFSIHFRINIYTMVIYVEVYYLCVLLNIFLPVLVSVCIVFISFYFNIVYIQNGYRRSKSPELYKRSQH